MYSDYLLNKGPAYGQVGRCMTSSKPPTAKPTLWSVQQRAARHHDRIHRRHRHHDAGCRGGCSLLQALESGEVDKDDCILLNISGGGWNGSNRTWKHERLNPWIRVKKSSAVQDILEKLAAE